MIIIGATAGEPVYRPPDSYPLPVLPNAAQVAFWWTADRGAFKDDAGTIPCSTGDGVAHWQDNGNRNNPGLQPIAARRPIYYSAGQGDRPFIRCNSADQHHFNALPAFDWGSGITNYSGWTVVAGVIKPVPNPTGITPIFGSAGTSYFKGDWYFYTDRRLRCWKNQFVMPAFLADTPTPFVFVTDGSCDYHWTRETGYTNPSNNCNNAPSGGFTDAQFLRKGSTGEYFNGDLYELIVWNGAGEMSSANQAIVVNYFKTKYAIT